MLHKVSAPVFLILMATTVYGQVCGPDAPTTFNIKGRVIAPGANFDGYHEVLQLDESRLVGFGYTNSTGEYVLPEQPSGYYYVVVRIDGIKEYRERINVFGCGKIFDHFNYM